MVDIFSDEYWKRYYVKDYDKLHEYLDFVKEILDSDRCNIYPHEWHHIVPKSFDSTLVKENFNFVELYPREHYKVHILLSMCFSGIYERKMVNAVYYMGKSIHKDKYLITPEEYEEAAIKYIEKLSERVSGESNPMYGVHLCGELNPMYGHDWTKEEREKMSESIKAWWEVNKYRLHPDNRGDKNPFYGKHHTEETKRIISNKMSEILIGNHRFGDLSGENNPMYGKIGEDNPNFGKHFINNGIRNKMVTEDEIDEYLNNGWVTGKIKIKRSEDVL